MDEESWIEMDKALVMKHEPSEKGQGGWWWVVGGVDCRWRLRRRRRQPSLCLLAHPIVPINSHHCSNSHPTLSHVSLKCIGMSMAKSAFTTGKHKCPCIENSSAFLVSIVRLLLKDGVHQAVAKKGDSAGLCAQRRGR